MKDHEWKSGVCEKCGRLELQASEECVPSSGVDLSLECENGGQEFQVVMHDLFAHVVGRCVLSKS